MLTFKNVFLSVGNQSILKNINFTINPGEKVAILGQSGAGKSSVFRLLIRELRPTKGSITLDELSLGDISFSGIQAYRRRIGVIFQDFKLLPQKTVFENISFVLEMCGKEEKIDLLVPSLLSLVGLKHKIDSFPNTLSGGEKQRTSIARALVHLPSILIADEATGNLDPKNAREICDLFLKLQQERGLTLIFSTHDPILIERLKPRIIRIENGEILFDKPYSSVEESFIGMM